MDRTSSNGGSPTIRSAEIQHVDNEAISFDYSEGLQPTDNPHPPPLVIHPPSPAVSAPPSLPPPAHISTPPTFTDKFNTSPPPNARPLSAANIKNRRVATDSPSDINDKTTNEPKNSNNFFKNNPQLGVGGSAGAMPRANDLMMQSHHVMMQRQQQRNQQKHQQQQQLTLQQHNNMTRQGQSLPHLQQPLLSPPQQHMERVKPHAQAQYSSSTPLESSSLKQLDHYSNTHNYTQPLSLQSPDNNQLDYLRSQSSSKLSPEHKRSSSLSPTRYKRYNPDNRPPDYAEGPPGGHLAPPSLPFNRSTSDPMEPVNPKSDSINDLVESKTSHNFYERPDIKMKMKKEAGIPTMTDFKIHVLDQISDKWRDFGLVLGVSPAILDDIERKYSGREPQKFFIEVFRHWEKVQTPPFLWSTIANVLEDPRLGLTSLAENIRLNFPSPIPPPPIGGGYSEIEMSSKSHRVLPDEDQFTSLPSYINNPPHYRPPPDLNIHQLTSSVNVLPSPSVPYNMVPPLSPGVPSESPLSLPNMTPAGFPLNYPPNVIPTPVPYSTGLQYNSEVPYITRPQYSNEVPYSTRPPYSNEVPYSTGLQYNSEVPYSSRPQYNHSTVPYSTGLPNRLPTAVPFSTRPLYSHSTVPELPYSLPTTTVHTGVPPRSNLHTSDVPYSSLHTTDVPYSSLHTTDVPYNRVHATDVPYSSLHTTDVPYSSLHTTDVPYSSLHTTDFVPQSNPYSMQSHTLPLSPYHNKPINEPYGVPIVTTPYLLQLATPSSLPSGGPPLGLPIRDDLHSMPGNIQPYRPPFLPQDQNNFFLKTSAVPLSATPQSCLSMPMSVISPQIVSQSLETESTAPPDDNLSSSSFYSAAEDDDVPSRKPRQDSWTELLQKYMENLENNSTKYPKVNRPVSPLKFKEPTQPVMHSQSTRQQKEKNNLQKELEKAYERISSLEVRVQDLTSQVSCDIPEDSEVSGLARDKLEQDYKRMKELKKKSEQQSMDAKQSAQRSIAENFHLKEEISQLKNDRNMLIMELRRFRRTANDKQQTKDKQIEITRTSLQKAIHKLKGYANDSPISLTRTPFMDVNEYAIKDFTPEVLWKIVTTEKSTIRLGQVAIVGLPGAGKTTMLNALLQKVVGSKNSIKPKGEPNYVEFYELMMQKNPLTGDSQWKMVGGIDCSSQCLATITAQYYFREKRMPGFIEGSHNESIDKLFSNAKHAHVKASFSKIFKNVQSILQKEKRKDGLMQLALFQPTFVNLWDLGVNRSLYTLLPEVARYCEHLMILDVLDLEKDVPKLDEPPVISSRYCRDRGDDELVMRLYSRLEYLMLFAGVKRWFNNNPTAIRAPEVTIIGTYTNEFAQRDNRRQLNESIKQLQSRITATAVKLGIDRIIDAHIVEYCIDGDKDCQDKELTILKETIEKMVSGQPNFEISIDANWMFFRALLYNSNTTVVSVESLYKEAHLCRISKDRLNDCLVSFRNVGSLLYAPEKEKSFAHCHVLLNIPHLLKLLDRLFYIEYYQKDKETDLSPTEVQDLEWYKLGLVTKDLATALFSKNESDNLLEFLINYRLCTHLKLKGINYYYMPSLLKKYHSSKLHLTSLYVQNFNHYGRCDEFLHFHRYLPKIFNSSDEETQFIPGEEFNKYSFTYTTQNRTKMVDIIYHKTFIEVHVTVDDNSQDKALNVDLCKKLINLCKEVYDDVCSNTMYLTYDLSIICPYSDNFIDKPHFIPFYENYTTTLYCKTCCREVSIDDDRLTWLMAAK